MNRSIFIALLFFSWNAGAGDQPSPLTWQKPTNGIYRIKLEVADGNVRIVGENATDQVRAELRLQARSMIGKTKECSEQQIRGIQIEPTVQSDIIHLNTNRSVKEFCDELWTLQVPEKMKIYVKIDSGDVAVQHVRRGVDVQSGAANIIVDVPQGPVRARAEVGSIQANIHGGPYSKVNLWSGSGKVQLNIDGYQVERDPREPGSGDRLVLTGIGDEEISLEATVGDVELNLTSSKSL